MTDDELLAPIDQVGQALPAVGPVEDMVLLDPLPGRIAAFLAQLIAQPADCSRRHGGYRARPAKGMRAMAGFRA